MGKDSQNKVLRYIVQDEFGPVRKFYTKAEAARWAKERPGCRVVVEPKVVPSSVFDTTPEAVF